MMETKNPFQRARQYRRPYFKPQWEIDEERKKAEVEEERKQAERRLERTEENFPALVSGPVKQVTWSGRKFNELAAEWKEETDKEKEVIEAQKTEEPAFVLPRFRSIRRFAEPEDIFEPPMVKAVDPEGEWETVERKTRKEKRELTFEELEAKYGGEHSDEEDGTVWGAPEEHQTCWDERR